MMEVRARAIAIFYALAQAAGALATVFAGVLIERPGHTSLVVGLLVAAMVMLVGAVVARVIAVDAENTSLEDVAPPLAVEAARSADRASRA